MRIADQTIEAFCSQLAAGTPAPGGGAAAAVFGAMGAALTAMVAGLTVGREKYAVVHEEMSDLQQRAREQASEFLSCADADMEAFNQVMVAFGLPRGTDEEKARRRQAVQEGYRSATRAPLRTMALSVAVMRGALAAAGRGNSNAVSDAYVGYLAASAAFEGALWNIVVNLGSLKDDKFGQEVLYEVSRLRGERTEIAAAFHDLTPDPIGRFLGQP